MRRREGYRTCTGRVIGIDVQKEKKCFGMWLPQCAEHVETGKTE